MAQNNQQSMSTISILGCGWLGWPLAKKLIADGHSVKGSTTSSEKLIGLRETGIQAYQLKATEQSLEGEAVSDFFHTDMLVLNIPPGGRRDPAAALAYPGQIEQVLRAAEAGTVEQLLFISSTGVYSRDGGVVNEDTPPDPDTASGRAVWEAEQLVRRYADWQPTVLRMSGLVGGSRRPGRFLAGKTNLPNGQNRVNLVHLEDCLGVVMSVLRQQTWGETFNVCADEHPTRADFYTQQAIKEGLTPPTFSTDNDGQYRIVDNTKLKKQLGYTLLHPNPADF